MRNATEMREGLAMYPALFLYPWDLASLTWMKSSGAGNQIPLDIPVVCLHDFSHPNQIPGKYCPFAIDGERYYFTKQVCRDASGNKSQRYAGEQGAFWKSTSTDIEIIDLDEKPIGYMRKYTLYEDKVDKRSANWLMEEYRVHDPDHELVDPYVLCKIYDKDSSCPRYTKTSIRNLRERIIERQSQTQFDGSDSHEDIIMQPPSENFPPESILPTSGPPDYMNGFSTSYDASGNQIRPEPIPSNPWNGNPWNQTHSDNNNFVEDHMMQQTFPTSENFPSDSIWPRSPLDSYSNEYCYILMDGISNGPSMPHNFSGNLNAVDGEECHLIGFDSIVKVWAPP